MSLKEEWIMLVRTGNSESRHGEAGLEVVSPRVPPTPLPGYPTGGYPTSDSPRKLSQLGPAECPPV